MTDTWKEWSKWVIETLKKCQEDLDELSKIRSDDILKIMEKLGELKAEIAVQKVKVGIWGVIGASIPSSAVLIVLYLKGAIA